MDTNKEQTQKHPTRTALAERRNDVVKEKTQQNQNINHVRVVASHAYLTKLIPSSLAGLETKAIGFTPAVFQTICNWGPLLNRTQS